MWELPRRNFLLGIDALKLTPAAGNRSLYAACIIYQSGNRVKSTRHQTRLAFCARQKQLKQVVSMTVRQCWYIFVSADDIWISSSSRRRKRNVPHTTVGHNLISSIILCWCTETKSIFWLLSVVTKLIILNVTAMVCWWWFPIERHFCNTYLPVNFHVWSRSRWFRPYDVHKGSKSQNKLQSKGSFRCYKWISTNWSRLQPSVLFCRIHWTLSLQFVLQFHFKDIIFHLTISWVSNTPAITISPRHFLRVQLHVLSASVCPTAVWRYLSSYWFALKRPEIASQRLGYLRELIISVTDSQSSYYSLECIISQLGNCSIVVSQRLSY